MSWDLIYDFLKKIPRLNNVYILLIIFGLISISLGLNLHKILMLEIIDYSFNKLSQPLLNSFDLITEYSINNNISKTLMIDNKTIELNILEQKLDLEQERLAAYKNILSNEKEKGFFSSKTGIYLGFGLIFLSFCMLIFKESLMLKK